MLLRTALVSLALLLPLAAAYPLGVPSPAPAAPGGASQLHLGLDALFGEAPAGDVESDFGGKDKDDDPCPDLLVRCLKDGDITKVVGDIGEQPYHRVGATCEQNHQSKNNAQCNLKFVKDCGGKCEAVGSPI